MKRVKERKQLKSYGNATILAEEYKNTLNDKKYINSEWLVKNR